MLCFSFLFEFLFVSFVVLFSRTEDCGTWWFQEVMNLRTWEFRNLEIPKFRHFGILELGSLWFRISEFMDFWNLGILGTCGVYGFRNLGVHEFKNSVIATRRIWDFGFLGILDGKLENSGVIELRILGSVESGGFWILGIWGFGN